MSHSDASEPTAITARHTPTIECVIEHIPGLKSTIQSRDQQEENIKNTCGMLIRN